MVLSPTGNRVRIERLYCADLNEPPIPRTARPLALTSDERRALQSPAGATGPAPQELRLRAAVILRSAGGQPNKQLADNAVQGVAALAPRMKSDKAAGVLTEALAGLTRAPRQPGEISYPDRANEIVFEALPPLLRRVEPLQTSRLSKRILAILDEVRQSTRLGYHDQVAKPCSPG